MNQDLFVRETAAHARTLRLPQSVAYLRAGCELLGDKPEAERLRNVYMKLHDCDEQLLLIENGQLKLTLE